MDGERFETILFGFFVHGGSFGRATAL
jgi:hypothetical protein